jgi:peptidoglycan/xylan/chitin deacetylase (PgdA/CDA1 family)
VIGWLARRLSPAGAAARLSVLILHRVQPEPDPLFPGEIDARFFNALCGWLPRWFTVLPLAEAARRLREGTLPAAALSITFDDGYADNHDVALPILKRHGLGATCFVATGFLDGGLMWNDRVIEALRRTSRDKIDLGALGVAGTRELPLTTAAERRHAIDSVLGAFKYLEQAERDAAVRALVRTCGAALPGDLMMRSSQVPLLAAGGMDIGAHTISHPILARLDAARAEAEMRGGRDALQALIDAPVPLFAYPNGRPGSDYLPEHVRLAREIGFEAAVSTNWGVTTRADDPFQIRRFTPWDRSRVRFGARLLANLRRVRD